MRDRVDALGAELKSGQEAKQSLELALQTAKSEVAEQMRLRKEQAEQASRRAAEQEQISGLKEELNAKTMQAKTSLANLVAAEERVAEAQAEKESLRRELEQRSKAEGDRVAAEVLEARRQLDLARQQHQIERDALLAKVKELELKLDARS